MEHQTRYRQNVNISNCLVNISKLSHKEIHIWSINLSLANEPIFKDALSFNEITKAQKFRFDDDRKRAVVSRGGLRIILGRYLNVEFQNLDFTHNSYGKPILKSQNNIYFNISHSGQYIIYALTKVGDIGIDIEHIKPDFATKEVANQFFSSAEVKAFSEIPTALQPQAFFNCWTRKEAFIKATGEGLSYPLKDFDVTLRPGEPAKLLSVKNNKEEASKWTLQEIGGIEGYKAAFAVKERDLKVKVGYYNPEY